MDHTIRLNATGAALVLGACLAVSLVTSTVVASRAIESRTKQAAKSRQEITVKGSTRVRVSADVAVWEIDVRGEGKELSDAYQAVESGVERIDKYLTDRGFSPAQIQLSAIETSTHYATDSNGRQTREIAGHSLSRSFSVTTPEVDRIAKAAGEVTQLIKEGVRVSSSRPSYYFSKAADMKVQILGDAAKDARARAEEIVKNSGGKLGPVRDARMGVLQITQPNSTEVSGEGMYDTATIEKDISAVVTVTFGVEGQ